MNVVQIDLDRLNEALQFCQEQMKPMSARVALRMVQEAIITPAPPKDSPKDEKPAEGPAEAHVKEMERQMAEYIPAEGETNG